MVSNTFYLWSLPYEVRFTKCSGDAHARGPRARAGLAGARSIIFHPCDLRTAPARPPASARGPRGRTEASPAPPSAGMAGTGRRGGRVHAGGLPLPSPPLYIARGFSPLDPPAPTHEPMTDTPLPQLSALLPRELAAELLALARASGATFADLYAEHAIVTGFALDEQRLKTASYSVLQGVGVRAVRGEQTGYAYADGFAPEALREAARVAARIAREAPPAASDAGGSPRAFRVAE